MAFIGLEVPDPHREELAAFAAREVPGRLEPVPEYHVTLFHLGKRVPFHVLARAMLAMRPVVAAHPQPAVGTARVVTFPAGDDGYPVVARVLSPGLLSLRAALAAAFDASGVPYSKRFPTWAPHVCLSYSGSPFPGTDVEPQVWTAQRLHVHGGDEWDDRFCAAFEIGAPWP